MKKYILCCIAALCSTFGMAADNISVQYEQVVRGETVTLSVNLNNSSSNKYVGFQMDLTLPAGFTLNKAGCLLGSRITDGSQELTIGKQGDNVYRLFSTSMNLTPISGNSGELLRLSLSTTRSTKNGILKISNIQFATNTSQRVAMSNVQLNLTFKKESQTLALASLPAMTYGDANYTLPAKTNEDLSMSWTSSNTSVVAVSNGQLVIKGAGSATVTASNSGSDYYNAFSKSYSVTVAKAPLTIRAGNYTKKQGEAMPTFTPSFEGFKNNETNAVLSRQPTISCDATANSVPGEYAVTVSGAQATNYEITYVNGKLTVTNADPVTITARSYTREYGEANPNFGFDVNGETLGGTPVIECAATKNSPVGTYPIVIKQGSVVNTNGKYINGTLTITKAPLTIKAGDYTKKQGDGMPTFTPIFSGFKNYETKSVLTKQPTISCEATVNSVPGEYAVTVSGAEAQNYEITHVNGKLTVTNADPVMLTARSYTREYGEENPDFAYVVSGETFGGTPVIECEATVNSPVGTYPIVIRQGSVVNTNTSFINGTLTITKAPLMVGTGEYTMERGEALPEFVLSYEGFKNGEGVEVLTKQPVATCAGDGTEAGEFAITLDGGEAENYAFVYKPGKLTVTDIHAVRNVLSCNELQTYAGYEQRTLEVCLTNADEVTLCQFDLHLPKDVSVATKASGSLDITMTSRGRKHSVTGQQQDDGSYRILTTSMTDNSFSGNEGVLMTIRLNLPKDIAVGEHEVLLDNIELSLPIEGNNLLVVRPADQRSKIVVLAHTPGDVNEDGKVSVTDAGYAVKYILELTPSVFCFAAADMNKDDLVTVTDVGCIVNTILGRPVLMRRAVRREAVQGTDQLTIEPVRMKAGESVELAVAMDNAVTNYMGWQCDMTLADGLTLTSGEDGYPEAVLGSRFLDTDHQIGANVRAAGGYRFIASSFDGNTIPGHSGTLFTVTLQAGDTMAAGTYEGKLTNIEFNTTDNQRILFGDLTFTVTIEPEGIKGDVNKDGTVDIADVVAVYNIMAGNNPNGLNGDVNADGATDIADVVAIYNIMAGGK